MVLIDSWGDSLTNWTPKHRLTMGQNQVILRHQKFTFPWVREWAREWAKEWAKRASEQASERRGGCEQSEQSGASERANRRASSPVLTSLFLFVTEHSATACYHSKLNSRWILQRRIYSSSNGPDVYPSPPIYSHDRWRQWMSWRQIQSRSWLFLRSFSSFLSFFFL